MHGNTTADDPIARKARRVLENTRHVLALELLAAAQGLDLQERILGRTRRIGRGTRRIHDAVRAAGIDTLNEDRYLEDDIQKARRLVTEPGFLDLVREACGAAGA